MHNDQSHRHLSSPDIPEAMTSCGWFGTGWLIRHSLLLRPPVEFSRRMFESCSCLLILSQIQISWNSAQSYMQNRENHQGNTDSRKKSSHIFLVTIWQVCWKCNYNTWANILLLGFKCRIFSSSSLVKLLKSYLTQLIVSFILYSLFFFPCRYGYRYES